MLWIKSGAVPGQGQGGRLDMRQAVASPVSAALPQVQAGNTRMLAAPQRMTGALATLPTMREQGIEATGISNFAKYLEAEYNATRAVMADLGLAR